MPTENENDEGQQCGNGMCSQRVRARAIITESGPLQARKDTNTLVGFYRIHCRPARALIEGQFGLHPCLCFSPCNEAFRRNAQSSALRYGVCVIR